MIKIGIIGCGKIAPTLMPSWWAIMIKSAPAPSKWRRNMAERCMIPITI